MTEQVTVTIDSREPDTLLGDFRSHPDVEDVIQRELPHGDILVGEMTFERKTPSDLVSSIKDNRLFSQARDLAEEDSVILLEGELDDFDALVHTQLPPSAGKGAIASVMVRAGVPVLPCGNRIDLVDMAIRLGRKSVEESTAFTQDGFENDNGTVSPMVGMYASIPGIGPERAKTLAEHFPSMPDLVLAPREEIEAIEGFGPKTAETVIKAVTGQLED